MGDSRRGAWVAALVAALGLHLAVLLLLQPPRHAVVAAAGPPMTWRVQVHPREMPAAPAAPVQQLAPEALARPRPPTTRRTAPPAEPVARPPAPAEAPPPPAETPTLTPGSTTLWLDANLATEAPTPVDNEWRLAEMPWPDAYPAVEVRLWITSDGRIERFELLGAAGDDPLMQQLFAPFADTPMRPAYFRSVRVPSTMRIQIWQGDGPAPDFVAPLPPASQ